MTTRIPLGIGSFPKLSFLDVGVMVVAHGNKKFPDSLDAIRIPVAAGTKHAIVVFVDASYEFWEQDSGVTDVHPTKKSGKLACKYSWEYVCSEQGEIGWGVEVPQPSQISHGLQITFASAQKDAKPPTGIEPYVFLSPQISYGGKGEGQGLGISIGYFGGSLPGARALPPSVGMVKGLRVMLDVVGVNKQKPLPPLPVPPREFLYRKILFEKENQTTLKGNRSPENTITALDQWVDRMKLEQPWLYKALTERVPAHEQHEKLRIKVTGYASPPGTPDDNHTVAKARAAFVADHLAHRFGTGTVELTRLSEGELRATEYPALTPDKYNRSYIEYRRVTIEIDPREARLRMEHVRAKERQQPQD